MRGFGSDNHAGVHPRILEALSQCNIDHQPSYGTDEWSQSAEKALQMQFGSHARGYFVFNGTGANVSALKSITQNHQAVLCSDVSHVYMDECGAVERFACKLIPVKSEAGKMKLAEIQKNFLRRGDQHFTQIQAITITQPTELGTCYSIDEIREICTWAHSQGLLVHLDGARLANAVVHFQSSFKAMTTDLGVDIVSLGGTKNGLMMGEAVIVLNPKLAQDYRYIRKQLTQLPSKTRYIAAQFLAYFEKDLWKNIAQHSLDHAQLLNETVRDIRGVEVTCPVQSNAVFAKIPKAWVKELRDKYFFYVWDEHTFECRWMISWDTQKEDIQNFAALLKKLSSQNLA